MKYRKLRIAWSIFWGILCLLLIVLCVRSYSWADICGVTITGQRSNFASMNGRVFLILPDYNTALRTIRESRTWDLRSMSMRDPSMSTKGEPFFYLKGFDRYYRVILPHLLLVLLASTLATVPWLRFSLRTLLIITTVVAIGLGWIVYTMRS